jgi:hypothetical protein
MRSEEVAEASFSSVPLVDSPAPWSNENQAQLLVDLMF